LKSFPGEVLIAGLLIGGSARGGMKRQMGLSLLRMGDTREDIKEE